MMVSAPAHRSRVFGTPWAGVHGTHIESARHYGRHSHEGFGLGLLEQGGQRSASGCGEVDARAGDLITTNPGEVHDGRPLEGQPRRWRMVYLEPAVMTAMAHGVDARDATDLVLARPVIQDARLRRAAWRLFRRLDAWNAMHELALACEESLVEVCAALLARHASRAPGRAAPDAPPRALRATRDRLAAELCDPPDLAELAASVGLSRYQLLRHFEKEYGLPPHAWLQQQRVQSARGLIRRGTPLVQVAAACGFADQSHMTRVFARHLGFTPGAWQRASAR